ncbi:hypothetical protein [Burkholderia ubonensis]|uniref:hypothetical protein n=1 Tax=Burkholderia ubonensis TaxID=101571 RepID=UPI0012FE5E3C|nr:hypothetical protein [Burkholderia ubonensis]
MLVAEQRGDHEHGAATQQERRRQGFLLCRLPVVEIRNIGIDDVVRRLMAMFDGVTIDVTREMITLAHVVIT